MRVVVGAREDMANKYIGNAEVPRRESTNEPFPACARAFRMSVKSERDVNTYVGKTYSSDYQRVISIFLFGQFGLRD